MVVFCQDERIVSRGGANRTRQRTNLSDWMSRLRKIVLAQVVRPYTIGMEYQDGVPMRLNRTSTTFICRGDPPRLKTNTRRQDCMAIGKSRLAGTGRPCARPGDHRGR
jgi:hypothetical protein